MARRINTRFVLILGSVLGLVGVTAGVVVVLDHFKKHRSDYWMKEGQAAEGRGDLSGAEHAYAQAARFMNENHEKDFPKVLVHLGDIEMKLAPTMDQQIQKVREYDSAKNNWARAIEADPTYEEAYIKFGEELKASASVSLADWGRLNALAKKMTASLPTNAKGYEYLAQSEWVILSVNSRSSGKMTIADVQAVEKIIKKALDLDPDNAEMLTLSWEVEHVVAGLIRDPGNEDKDKEKKAQAIEKAADEQIKAYVAKHPEEPKSTAVYAQVLLKAGKKEEGMKLMQDCLAKNPDSFELGIVLLEAYRQQNNLKGMEDTYHAMITGAPNEQMSRYKQLGDFYAQLNGRLEDAVKAYKDALAHPYASVGVGIQKNDQITPQCLYSAAWYSMEYAEQLKSKALGESKEDRAAKDAKAKQYIEDAKPMIERLRVEFTNARYQDILDGRMALINGDIAGAISSLQSADLTYGSGIPNVGPWLQTKQMLVRAYSAQGDWGTAERYASAIHGAFPRDPRTIIPYAGIVFRAHKYQEVLNLCEPLLNKDVNLPDNARDLARQLVVEARKALGMDLKGIDIPSVNDDFQNSVDLRQAEILRRDGQLTQALAKVGEVLKRSPENIGAQQAQLIILIQMKDWDHARPLADAAIKKYPDIFQFRVLRATMDNPDDISLDRQLKVVDQVPDETQRHMARAQLMETYRQPEKALEEYKQAELLIEKNGSTLERMDIIDRNFSLIMSLAQQAKTQKNDAKVNELYAQAEGYVQKAERYNTDGVHGKLYRGQLQFANGDRQGGIATLEAAVAERSDFSMGRAVLGVRYQMMGQVDKAREQLRQAVEQKPDNLLALRGLIDVCLRKGDADSKNEALKYLEQARSYFPNDPVILNFGDFVGDPAEQIRRREMRARFAAGDTENIYRLADLYEKAGEPDKAAAVLEPVAKQYPDNLLFADKLAVEYAALNRVNEALALYERFLSGDDATRYAAYQGEGELYLKIGKPDAAVAMFKEAIARQPAGQDQAQKRLADIYFDAGMYAEAGDLYQTIYKAAADKTKPYDDVMRRVIECLIRQEKFTDADALLNNEILSKRPNDAVGLNLKGYALVRQEKFDDASACFNKVLDIDPNNVDALYFRASAELSTLAAADTSNLDKARKDLERAQDIMKDRDVSDMKIEVCMQLAKVHRLARRFGEAANQYDMALKWRPESVQVRQEYAEYLLSIFRVLQTISPKFMDEFSVNIRSADSEARLKRLLSDSESRFPNQPQWLVYEAQYLGTKGDLRGAALKYEDVLKKYGENPMAGIPYLTLLMSVQHWDDAIGVADQLIKARPDYAPYYMRRGVCYASSKRADKAAADFNAALDLTATNMAEYVTEIREVGGAMPAAATIELAKSRLDKGGDAEHVLTARAGYAVALLMGKQTVEGSNVVESVLADPLMSQRKNYDALLFLRRSAGMARYEMKDFEGSVNQYKALLKVNPDDLESLNNISFTLAEDLKRPADALPFAEHALMVLQRGNINPSLVSNANVYDTYGWVKVLAGQVEDGIAVLKRAKDIEPLADAYLHLGKALVMANKKDEATRVIDDGIFTLQGRKDPSVQELIDYKNTLK